jgi:hypothetical protein
MSNRIAEIAAKTSLENAPAPADQHSLKVETTANHSTLSPQLPVLPTSSKMAKNGEICGIKESFNLSPLQLDAIRHTLLGTHQGRIAEILGIDRKTLWNWKKFNSDYRRALAVAREMLHDQVADQCQAVLARAVRVIEEYLDCADHDRRIRAVQLALKAAAHFKLPESRRSSSD